MGTILREWLNENTHRQFPLADTAPGKDTTGGFELPQSFLTDMFLCVPLTADITNFFISNLVVRRYTIDITISYEKSIGDDIIVGYFNQLDTGADPYSVYAFSPATQALDVDKPFELIKGSVVTGVMDEIKQHAGSWTFDLNNGEIQATCISQGLAALHSIQVGSQIFTGDVQLKEGVNIRLIPSYDPSSGVTTITVSADLGGLDTSTVPLTNDTAVLQNLINTYGTPLTTINGTRPDVNGNFVLRPIDCTEFKSITGGLEVSNPCSLPCCDKSVLDDIYESVSQLNQRYARMQGYYENLSRNVNELQAQLLGLEL